MDGLEGWITGDTCGLELLADQKQKNPQHKTPGFKKNDIFFHPDFTVGFGVTPNQPYGSRAIPPVGNFTLP